LEDTEAEDGKLRRSGDGDALLEDGGGVGGDAIEEAAIDADENEHGGTGVGVEERDEFGSAAVIVLRAVNLESKQGKCGGINWGASTSFPD
jgi:hypothetical protein